MPRGTGPAVAERLYARLLGVYPPEFRARFGGGMRDAFARDYEAARRGGLARRLAFVLVACADAARFGLQARARQRQGGVPMRSRIASFFTVDFRAAVRSLRSAPVVTAAAVGCIALGIGANTALFSILDGLILKSLPVHEPSRLVVIDGGSWTNPIWEQIRAHRQDVFEDAFAWNGARFNLSPRGQTEYVDGAWASGGMFRVLGVQPAIGRLFTEADDVRRGGPDGPVAVLSYSFWQRRFGGAADAVGRQLDINNVAVTIVGVAQAGFFGPDVGRSADIIVPIGVRALTLGGPRTLDGRATWWLEIMGRLRPNQTRAEAAAALDAIQPQIRLATMPEMYPAKEKAGYLSRPWTLSPAATGESDLRRTYLAPLEIVLVIVGAVLLIACANLASLLLARAESRRRELSIRLALGASRFRISKQLLAESTLLAAAGGLLGLLLARWGSLLLVRQLDTTTSGITLDLSIDWRILGFTAAVAAVTALVFGLAPALGVAKLSPQDAMKEQSRGVAGGRRSRLRSGLVVGQIALSLALVVAATLFLRTLSSLVHASLGFDPNGLVVAGVDTRVGDKVGREARLALFDRLHEAAASVPGAAGSGLSVLTPFGNMGWNTIVEPTPATASLSERQRIVWVNAVSPAWFQTFGMRLVAGRDFDGHDTSGAPPVVIVTETFARRFFPGQPAIGQDIRSGLEGPTVTGHRIVGIVNDAAFQSQRAGLVQTIYMPFAQAQDVSSSAVLTVRAAPGAADRVTREIAAAIARVAPSATFGVRTMDAPLRAAVRQERLVALLAGFFGALAVALAALGLYGVTSHSVSQRRTEIGIRMAIGADAGGVVRLVLGRLGWLAATGVAGGLALSWWAAKYVQTLVFGLPPRDPLTLAAAAGLLAIVALAAGWIPARRAAHIDPIQVLREN